MWKNDYLYKLEACLLTIFMCGFLAIIEVKAQTNRVDSLSYENYLRMLDEESKISLADVQEDEKPEYLKERIATYYQGDRNSYKFYRGGVLQAIDYAPKYAMDMAKRAGLPPSRANILEGVYLYIYDLELKLLDDIGPKKFDVRHIAATPKFAHLKVLQEVKLREMLNKEDHYRYFMKHILPGITGGQKRVVEKDEFKCGHYIRKPLFTKGNITEWISKNVKYPQDALKNNWQGKVIVRYTVEVDGSVTDVKVVTPARAVSLNLEAIRVVKSFPKFIPAWCPIHQCNRRCNLTVPISFQLQ